MLGRHLASALWATESRRDGLTLCARKVSESVGALLSAVTIVAPYVSQRLKVGSLSVLEGVQGLAAIKDVLALLESKLARAQQSRLVDWRSFCVIILVTAR